MEKDELIGYVIKTLGDIEVKGKENLSKLLGCIMALEEALQKNECEVTDHGRQGDI